MSHDYNYINDFKRDNYDRIEILLAKGSKKQLKALSKETGESVNNLVVSATEEKYKLDLSSKR